MNWLKKLNSRITIAQSLFLSSVRDFKITAVQNRAFMIDGRAITQQQIAQHIIWKFLFCYEFNQSNLTSRITAVQSLYLSSVCDFILTSVQNHAFMTNDRAIT